MKKQSLFFIIFLFYICSIALFADWEFVTGGYVSEITFVGSSGWAVENEGRVRHTTDSGSSWEIQYTDTEERLYGVEFVTELIGWVCGGEGVIKHTIDGGANWTTQSCGSSARNSSIHFLDDQEGWMASYGGNIFHTTDGGANWLPQTTGVTNNFYSICFVDANNGWVVGSSDMIMHTTDGGATWTVQTNPTTSNMQCVVFYDALEGWAAGSTKIIHTIDGGTTWTLQSNSSPQSLYGMALGTDNLHLCAVGINGVVLTSNDGGANWVNQSFSYDWFLGTFFEDNLSGWIVGAGGAIFHTTDGGANWTPQADVTCSGLRRAVCLDEQNFWGCGSTGCIIGSNDGGLSWDRKDTGFTDWIWDITFAPDLMHGWAACDDQSGQTPILATIDGGETWFQQLSGITTDIVGIEAASTTEVWAAALSGVILYTNDGGTTWNQQTSGVWSDFKSIEILSADIGWAVGTGGVIIHTTDGGTTWNQQNSGTAETLYDISFADSQNGWAAGNNGVMLHTTDGGTTWNTQIVGTNEGFNRISAIDANELWAVADHGFHTIDGGITWTQETLPCNITLWGIAFANSNLGVSMGNGGIVGRYTSTTNTFDPPQNVQVDEETGLVTWTPPATIISEDNFDNYTPGDYLGMVNPTLWTTWSNLPGSSEDVVVTDAQSNSPDNSILVELNNDCVMIMDEYTSGVYSMDIDMYVPSGYCGYYNLQKTSVPGTEWGFQIYFLTDGTTIIDAGAPSAATFNYLHDEWMDLRLVVDLDSDWAEFYYNGNYIIGYQWSLGLFGTPGLLQLGGMNIFGGANSGTMDTPMFFVDNVEFKELIPAADPLTGYNVYLDGIFLGYTTDLEYQLTGLIAGQTYTVGIQAVYDNGLSIIIEYTFVYNPVTTFDPPNNLEAAIEDYNSVNLTWDLPGGTSEEILYHTGYDNNGIGTNGVVDFICCARFTAEELAEYYGDWSITGVHIFLHSMDFSYVGIKIYEGGSVGNPGTMIYDQDITASAVALDWTNHQLSMPIPLTAGNEYWIGYDLSATGDHPAAVDMGPMVPDKGGWLYYNGAWDTLTGLGLDYNWVITGVVTETDAVATNSMKKKAVIGRKAKERIHTARMDALFEAEYSHKVRQIITQPSPNSRSLSGFKVYRNGIEIAEILYPNLEYLDFGLDAGFYDYCVTAIYTNPDGESIPSNTVSVEIILPAPINISLTSNWPNILITWTPMPGVQSYNLYIDGELLANTTSTFFLWANVPPGYYIFNIAAVFNGGWEGEWSPDYPIGPWPGTDPNLVPLVTSLDGNYPNPFNPTTMIKFGLSENAKVVMDVYNIKGEKVCTLVNNNLEAGYHDILWNGEDDSGKAVSSGVYFYKMKAGKYQESKKMLMMK